MLTLADIVAARRRIEGTIQPTPLVPSAALQRLAGAEFLLKLEIGQPTGAFKLRGAANAIARLPAETRGVTCCSTGNHGRAVAYAAAKRGLRAVICMSSLVPKAKIGAIEALGAEVRIVGASQDKAGQESLRLCEEEGLVEISPFDDADVIAGQGTAGLEMIVERPDLDMVLVPLSGGGLAGGVALAVKTVNPKARVIGVSMDRGAAMHESLKAGRPVEVSEVASLADSLGGGIGLDNRLSFDLCRTWLDDTILVSEEEIYRAMQTLYYEDRIVAEGACAVGIAALQAGRLPPVKGPVATLITGRGVDMEVFTRIVTGQDVTLGDLTIKGRPYAA